MKDLTYTAKGPNTGSWRDRHLSAVRSPQEFEAPMVHGINAWLLYATRHKVRYESEIGEDHYCGLAWEQWGRAMHKLLNGDTGRLHCGTLSAIIIGNLVEQGFGEEGA